MDRYEDFERTLDPHRADEQAAVAAEGPHACGIAASP